MPHTIRYALQNPKAYENFNLVGKKGDWIDLHVSETVTLKKGEYKLIALGIQMRIPKGYEAHLVPRSSTFKNYGILLTNSVGIIDNSYCGPEDWWFFPAYATRDVTIEEGSRICQFRIIENQPLLNFIRDERLKGESRGGLGSTGK